MSDVPPEARLYIEGHSIPEIAEMTGIARSTLRHRFKRLGILRTRSESMKIAARKGRLSKGKGRKRKFTPEWCENISKGRRAWGDKNAKGTSLKPNGYLEITRGPNKGKTVHAVTMEARLGRSLRPDECVHHIDGDRTNNDENNLALVTRSGHTRLHRFEDALAGRERERKANGRFA